MPPPGRRTPTHPNFIPLGTACSLGPGGQQVGVEPHFCRVKLPYMKKKGCWDRNKPLDNQVHQRQEQPPPVYRGKVLQGNQVVPSLMEQVRRDSWARENLVDPKQMNSPQQVQTALPQGSCRASRGQLITSFVPLAKMEQPPIPPVHTCTHTWAHTPYSLDKAQPHCFVLN